MNQYLVDLEIPAGLPEEFASLLPEQREQINLLMNEGTISSFCLSLDQTKVWVTFNAESEDEVRNLINSMPLGPYLSATIYELAFFNAVGNGLPAISLN